MTHQGGLADIERLRPFRRPLNRSKHRSWQWFAQQCKRIVERMCIRVSLILDLISFKINPPKAFQNHFKTIQILEKIVAKMVPNRGLKMVWGAFWQLGGRFLAFPGSKTLVGR